MTYSYTDLKKLLEKERLNLYIIVGNDTYLISSCVRLIVSKHEEDEVVNYDLTKLVADDLKASFFSFPFFSGRLVVVDNFNPTKLNAEQKELFDSLLSSIPDFLIVILTNCFEGRFGVNKQYEKLAETVKDSAIITAEKPVGSQALRLVAQLAAKEGAKIKKDAAELLFFLAGDDMFSIVSEIKKLAAFCSYTTIEREHVRRITVKSTESSVFDMISALEKQDIRTALIVLREMIDNRTEPIIISSTLNTAFINLYRAKLISEKNRRKDEMYSLFDYRKDDRKVSIALSRVANYTKAQLSSILKTLYQLDIDLKSSPVDRNIILEQAVIEIAMSRS